MIRWSRVVRLTISAALIPVLIPGTLILLMLWFYGFTLEVVLAIIVLLQLYVVAFQSEITLRQTAIFEAEHQPSFKIEVEELIDKDGRLMYGKQLCFSLRNVGKYPAYNIAIGLVQVKEDRREEPIEESLRLGGGIHILSPGLTESLSFLKYSDDVVKMQILARVSYEDMLGELRESIFLKLRGYKDFMFLRAPISIRKGWLTRSIEDLLLTKRIIHFAKLEKERKTGR